MPLDVLRISPQAEAAGVARMAPADKVLVKAQDETKGRALGKAAPK